MDLYPHVTAPQVVAMFAGFGYEFSELWREAEEFDADNRCNRDMAGW